MKIYIASSWKNQHAVEMLTELLRSKGHYVHSWVENCNKEQQQGFDFEEWVKSKEAGLCFEFDTMGATQSDLLIYIGPAGKDAAAEIGAAWASKIPIIGLYAKGEDFGLMRKMIQWYGRYSDIIQAVEDMHITNHV